MDHIPGQGLSTGSSALELLVRSTTNFVRHKHRETVAYGMRFGQFWRQHGAARNPPVARHVCA